MYYINYIVYVCYIELAMYVCSVVCYKIYMHYILIVMQIKYSTNYKLTF